MPSYDHGWSSGAAPALTNYVLGVQPASPGLRRRTSPRPHPADLAWARGIVPTPHGPIAFRWARRSTTITATVVAPVAGTIILPRVGPAKLDGKRIREQSARTAVKVGPGTHTLVVTT